MTVFDTFRIDLLLLYVAATGLFSYVTMRLFGRRSVRVFALLFLFNTLMVVVGPVLTLLFYFYLNHNRRKIPVIDAHLLDVAQLQRHFPLVKRRYAEGPPQKFLSDEKSPEARKVRLLTHLIQKLERQDVRLLQTTLSGKSDESRLLSFGVLNNMEQRLNDRIGDLQERLSHESDSVQRAIYEQEIAYLYREFVYYGLVTKELEPFYLRNAAEHALRALEAYPDPAEVYLLLGKIYLYVGDFRSARRAFTKAMEDSRYLEETLPYLAELTFAQKDFKNFRKILPALRRLHYSPRASKLTSLWRAS